MRLSAVVLALAVGLAVGLAAAPAAVGAQTADEDARNVVESYNENVDGIPDVVRDRFADERIELNVERSDGEDAVYTAVTDDSARVVSLEEGSEDPTLRVTMDEETLRDVGSAENPVRAGVDAYESDAVDVEGVGVANTVAVEATKAGYAVASTLGLL